MTKGVIFLIGLVVLIIPSTISTILKAKYDAVVRTEKVNAMKEIKLKSIEKGVECEVNIEEIEY